MHKNPSFESLKLRRILTLLHLSRTFETLHQFSASCLLLQLLRQLSVQPLVEQVSSERRQQVKLLNFWPQLLNLRQDEISFKFCKKKFRWRVSIEPSFSFKVKMSGRFELAGKNNPGTNPIDNL